jgi:WD40 repeat protein
MNFRSAVLIMVIVLVPVSSMSESRALHFVKQIGVGWQPDNYMGWMGFVSFSPDGAMVASDSATAADDTSGDLTLWSFPEGRLIKSLPGRPTAISDDWKYYATSQSVREIETGKVLISLGERDDIRAVHAFSADSRYVAESVPYVAEPVWGKEAHDFRIRVVELASGKQVSAFGKYNAFSLAISPYGKTLASGHWDEVVLWSIFTGEQIGVLRGFGRYVESLSFSRDGKLLAGGTDSGGLQIWDLSTQTKVQSLEIEGEEVSNPAFSPDGRLVAVGIYGTGTVWLIDVGSGKILDQEKVSGLGCGSVAFSPDGHFLITPSTGGLIKWPYDRGGTIRVFEVSVP